jgi:hypothetical protein
VWCHWCHVMDETTYKTPEVIALIGSKYIPVRVDRIRGRTFRTGTRTTAGRPRWCSRQAAARSSNGRGTSSHAR